MDFIKSLWEVQENDHICLVRIPGYMYPVKLYDKLCSAWSASPEVMLLIAEEMIPIKVVYNCTVYIQASSLMIDVSTHVYTCRNDVSSLAFIWYLTMIKGELEHLCHTWGYGLCTLLQDKCCYFIRSSAVPWVISKFYSHECNIVHSRERAWSQSRQGNLNPPGYRQNETDRQRWNLCQCHCGGIRLLISVSLSGINHDCVLWVIIRSSWQHPPSKLCVLARFASGIALWVPWHL